MSIHRRLKKFSNRIKAMSPTTRIIIGVLLLLGGILGLLPILGFWMIPLGLLMLSVEFPWARKSYLNLIVWLRKFRKKKALKE